MSAKQADLRKAEIERLYEENRQLRDQIQRLLDNRTLSPHDSIAAHADAGCQECQQWQAFIEARRAV
jgi:hypothetical protein